VEGEPRARAGATTRARDGGGECGWGSGDACGGHDTLPYTLFTGGVGIDFVRPPKRGTCAELIIWVKGKARSLGEHLFRPGSGSSAMWDQEARRTATTSASWA
jgi:hypothetical protein